LIYLHNRDGPTDSLKAEQVSDSSPSCDVALFATSPDSDSRVRHRGFNRPMSPNHQASTDTRLQATISLVRQRGPADLRSAASRWIRWFAQH